MAAPCGGMATRAVVPILTRVRRTWTHTGLLRRGLGTSPGASRTEMAERAVSPWTLLAAVCVQRLPLLSAEVNPVEQRVGALLEQVELEKSLLCDHELRLMEDATRSQRKQADDYDSDEEDGGRGGGRGDQEIVLAQDLEDAWEQKLKSFQMAPRVRAHAEEDLTSLERCLDQTLLLLAQHQVGDRTLWLLPQKEWREGESLRGTAERALASVSADFKATFLSNAPCGVYKYKLPKAARTDRQIGMKVFFFKAVLSDRAPPVSTSTPFLWLKKSELGRYLTPAYGSTVQRFLLQH